MCLLRLWLTCLSAVAFHVAASSPTKENFSFRHAPGRISMLEIGLRTLLRCKAVVKVLYWGLTLAEALDAVRALSCTVSDPDKGTGPCKTCDTVISPTFLLGGIIALSASLLRVMCYRTLGDMFTFTLTLRRDHKLITSGPYSIVRHPSYIALIICILGILVMQGSEASWLRQSGWLDALWAKFLVLFWVLSVGAATGFALLRMREEDEMMREVFGDEWVSWASRVKHRLIPGVY